MMTVRPTWSPESVPEGGEALAEQSEQDVQPDAGSLRAKEPERRRQWRMPAVAFRHAVIGFGQSAEVASVIATALDDDAAR